MATTTHTDRQQDLQLHNEVTSKVLSCAVEVHRALGPGLKEFSYQAAMALEMAAQNLEPEEQPSLAVEYRGIVVGTHRPDFIVERLVVVEIKSAIGLDVLHTKQVLTYLRVTKLRVGLLINFNTPVITAGLRRVVL